MGQRKVPPSARASRSAGAISLPFAAEGLFGPSFVCWRSPVPPRLQAESSRTASPTTNHGRWNLFMGTPGSGAETSLTEERAQDASRQELAEGGGQLRRALQRHHVARALDDHQPGPGGPGGEGLGMG